MTYIATHQGTPIGEGFATKAEAQMYVNRNNGTAARRGDESKPYALFEGEVALTYRWSHSATGRDLIRTRTYLRNVQPGFQEYVASRSSEAYQTDNDWLEGVAFANEVEADEALANHVDKW